jgi:hypothetical protein
MAADLQDHKASHLRQLGHQTADHRMPVRQFLSAPDQGVAVAGSNDQAKGLQHATDLGIQFGPHCHQLMANPQHGPALVRGNAFDVHCAIPSHAQHLGKTTSVAAV